MVLNILVQILAQQLLYNGRFNPEKNQ